MSKENSKYILLLLLSLLPSFLGLADGRSTRDLCSTITCSIDCTTMCDKTSNTSYRIQECICCCKESNEAQPLKEDTVEKRLETLEVTVNELRVMTGVLLGLVLLLILTVLAVVLHLTKNIPRLAWPIFRKIKKDAASLKERNSQQKKCNGVTDPNAVVGRIANHQTNGSPMAKRASFRRSTHGGPTEDTVDQPEPRAYRVRQPSESTCPDEGADIEHGYDNLGLSTSTIHTSTLHNTSNSSTDTLGPTVSTNTLDTTLHSETNIHSAVNNATV